MFSKEFLVFCCCWNDDDNDDYMFYIKEWVKRFGGLYMF